MLIAICGADGSGKSTQARRLADQLKATYMAFPDRETPAGKLIDAWLKGEWAAAHKTSLGDLMLPDSELNGMVFQALQTTNRLEVLPKLEEALVWGPVVADRYWMSGYAYGSADGLPGDWLELIHQSLPQPTASVLLDIDVDIALERMKSRKGAEVYERRETLEAVILHYRELWLRKRRLDPDAWMIVDARGTKEDTYQQILDVLGDAA